MVLLLLWKRGREAWDFLLGTLKHLRRHIGKRENPGNEIDQWHAL